MVKILKIALPKARIKANEIINFIGAVTNGEVKPKKLTKSFTFSVASLPPMMCKRPM